VLFGSDLARTDHADPDRHRDRGAVGMLTGSSLHKPMLPTGKM
jgi:hypothetical protein